MTAGYGNDNNSDGNDEDVDRGPRAKENQDLL